MPTPFMHLRIAEQILAHPALDGAALARLSAEKPAFYLGNIAADFQSICNIPRENTHFYKVPIMPEQGGVGYERMLADHPQLAQASTLLAADAAFTIGYIIHLHYDLVWYHKIGLPYFVFSNKWDGIGRRERFTIHNVLLTYLDKRSLGRLPDTAQATLAAAPTTSIMPFVDDDELAKWRDMVSEQLRPNAPIHTVQIYADRIGITPDEFAARLANSDWMQENVFDRVPTADVHAIFEEALAESVTMTNQFLLS